MQKFEVVSEYQPSGDQPQAIAALAEGIENGLKEQVSLSVTGSARPYSWPRSSSRCSGPRWCCPQ